MFLYDTKFGRENKVKKLFNYKGFNKLNQQKIEKIRREVMPTPHNQAKFGEIAKNILMPGDPLRAKFIAETFLENIKLVNSVRNMLAYTCLLYTSPSPRD